MLIVAVVSACYSVLHFTNVNSWISCRNWWEQEEKTSMCQPRKTFSPTSTLFFHEFFSRFFSFLVGVGEHRHTPSGVRRRERDPKAKRIDRNLEARLDSLSLTTWKDRLSVLNWTQLPTLVVFVVEEERYRETRRDERDRTLQNRILEGSAQTPSFSRQRVREFDGVHLFLRTFTFLYSLPDIFIYVWENELERRRRREKRTKC